MRDIVASQSGHEVISLQKMDSLLLFLNVTEKLRRFLRRNAGGIWTKIHLNPITRARVDCYIEENAGLALLSKHHHTESDFLTSVMTV